jgi:hypothetical protein
MHNLYFGATSFDQKTILPTQCLVDAPKVNTLGLYYKTFHGCNLQIFVIS